jgi:hypothetical protein
MIEMKLSKRNNEMNMNLEYIEKQTLKELWTSVIDCLKERNQFSFNL